jgi:hypothetical protein
MKKQILNIVIALSMIVTLAVAGFAGLGGRLKANVPFEFSVNGKTLPAGDYTIQPGTTNNTLIIRNRHANQVVTVFAQTTETRGNSTPKLVFRRYGNQYFLAKAFSYESGSEFTKSKAERQAAKSSDRLAQHNADPEIVTIVAQVGE